LKIPCADGQHGMQLALARSLDQIYPQQFKRELGLDPFG